MKHAKAKSPRAQLNAQIKDHSNYYLFMLENNKYSECKEYSDYWSNQLKNKVNKAFDEGSIGSTAHTSMTGSIDWDLSCSEKAYNVINGIVRMTRDGNYVNGYTLDDEYEVRHYSDKIEEVRKANLTKKEKKAEAEAKHKYYFALKIERRLKEFFNNNKKIDHGDILRDVYFMNLSQLKKLDYLVNVMETKKYNKKTNIKNVLTEIEKEAAF